MSVKVYCDACGNEVSFDERIGNKAMMIKGDRCMIHLEFTILIGRDPGIPDDNKHMCTTCFVKAIRDGKFDLVDFDKED